MSKLLLQENFTDVTAATQQCFKAQEHNNLCEEAPKSYDRGAYELAPKYWIAAAVIGGTILLILVASILFQWTHSDMT